MTDLKFTVKYSRRVQPEPYEHITYGLEASFNVGDVTRSEAFKQVTDEVEKAIDEKLQELWAKQRR